VGAKIHHFYQTTKIRCVIFLSETEKQPVNAVEAGISGRPLSSDHEKNMLREERKSAKILC